MKRNYIMPRWASKMYLKQTKKNPFLMNSYSFIAQDTLKNIVNSEDKVILDIGTGPGMLLIELLKKKVKNKLIGIDISPNMVEVAKTNLEFEHITNKIEFQVANVIDLPFENNSIDYVISSFSIHEWPDPEQALNEILKKMKQKGIALIYDINPSFSEEIRKELISDYGRISNLYLKRISKSFGKTLKILGTFITNEKSLFQYSFEIHEMVFKMIFTKKE